MWTGEPFIEAAIDAANANANPGAPSPAARKLAAAVAAIRVGGAGPATSHLWGARVAAPTSAERRKTQVGLPTGAARSGFSGADASQAAGVNSPVNPVTQPAILSMALAEMSAGKKAGDPFAERRRRLIAAATLMGIDRELTELPLFLQTFLAKRKAPDPELVFDASYPRGKTWRALRRELERRFRAAEFEIDEGSGRRINWREYQTFLATFMETAQIVPMLSKTHPAMRKFSDAIRSRVTHLLEDCQLRSSRAVFDAVVAPLVLNSRCDEKLLTAEYVCERDAAGKLVSRLIVRADEAEARDVSINGKRRPMVRVTGAGPKIEPVSWKGSAFRLTGANAEREFPVFVQAHAIAALHDRLDEPRARPALDYWMTESLKTPKIIGRRGDELLVEYRLNQIRVGYLVCTPLPAQGIVAVRTFLFLTMEGTPEAKQIAQQLKLRRDEIEWLSLQKLSGFTRTDIGDDRFLRAKLRACGCGRLFDLRDADYTPTDGSAAELRKFLGMAA